MTAFDISSRILDVLQCFSCQGSLSFTNGIILCNKCRHSYPTHNGIPDMRPPSSIPPLRIHNDPDYRKFYENLAFIREGFSQPGLISWGQDSGHKTVKRLMGNKKYRVIVDFGCGEGAHSAFLDTFDNVIGVDIEQGSLERLKKCFPDFFVIRADGYNLPIKDNIIDCIVSIYNLEHMAYLDLALEEIQRILSQNGDLFISVPNEGGLAFVMGRNLITARKFSTQSFNYRRAAEIEHLNCIWQLERAFKRHFTVKKKTSFPFQLPFFHLNLVTTYHCVKSK